MKKLILELVQGFLAVAAMCLLAAIIIPWKRQASPLSPPAAPAMLPADPIRVRQSPEPASPEAVLTLFVKRSVPSATRALPAPEASKPVDAPWLVFLGFYSSAPGEPCFLLKDTRSGRVITIGLRSAPPNRWALVAIEDTRLIVRMDSETYIVKKR